MGKSLDETCDIHEDAAVMSHPRWYAVQCQPHRERLAVVNLEQQGYTVFLPRRRRTIRHARKMETVLRPYFPGYLFVQLDLASDRWRPVARTAGVVRLVSQGDRPAPAPEGVVEGIKEFCDERDILEWQSTLVCGQTVRISDGPFTGLVGALEQLSETGRVRVLLEMMGMRVPADVARSQVEPAQSQV